MKYSKLEHLFYKKYIKFASKLSNVQALHTKKPLNCSLEVVKRTNKHLDPLDEQTSSCCGVKTGIKRKARESQDCSHLIVGETLQTVTEGTAAMLPRLSSLKPTIQHQRVRRQFALQHGSNLIVIHRKLDYLTF